MNFHLKIKLSPFLRVVSLKPIVISFLSFYSSKIHRSIQNMSNFINMS